MGASAMVAYARVKASGYLGQYVEMFGQSVQYFAKVFLFCRFERLIGRMESLFGSILSRRERKLGLMVPSFARIDLFEQVYTFEWTAWFQ